MVRHELYSEIKNSAWQKKPRVYHKAFNAEGYNENIFLALKRLKDALSKKSDKYRTKSSLNGLKIETATLLEQIPFENLHSLSDIEQFFLENFEENAEVGLMVNNIQSLHPYIWKNTTEFLSNLYQQIGFPMGGAVVDLFWGNYQKSFLGLHKDDQDIFAFVFQGKKTMLAWPYEYFSDHFENMKNFPNGSHQLPLDYKPYEKDAIRLDAEPGDLIVWPSDYWHIAVSDEQSFSAMLSLGLFRHRDQTSIASKKIIEDFLLTNEIKARSTQPTPPHSSDEKLLTEFLELNDAITKHPQYQHEFYLFFCGWLSSAGFNPGLELEKFDLKRPAKKNVRETGRGLFRVLRLDDKIYIGGSGAVFVVSYDSKLYSHLKTLQQGNTADFHDIKIPKIDFYYKDLLNFKRSKTWEFDPPETGSDFLINYLTDLNALESI